MSILFLSIHRPMTRIPHMYMIINIIIVHKCASLVKIKKIDLQFCMTRVGQPRRTKMRIPWKILWTVTIM